MSVWCVVIATSLGLSWGSGGSFLIARIIGELMLGLLAAAAAHRLCQRMGIGGAAGWSSLSGSGLPLFGGARRRHWILRGDRRKHQHQHQRAQSIMRSTQA
ncbi:MAG: hypothetical protein MI861_14625 [Pirellulales bacterium]|nr:hypothetical protein [Pirellulales bacterium]